MERFSFIGCEIYCNATPFTRRPTYKVIIPSLNLSFSKPRHVLSVYVRLVNFTVGFFKYHFHSRITTIVNFISFYTRARGHGSIYSSTTLYLHSRYASAARPRRYALWAHIIFTGGKNDWFFFACAKVPTTP